MRRDRRRVVWLISCALTFLLSFLLPSQRTDAAPATYAPDQLIVQYKAGKTPTDTLMLNTQYGVTSARRVFTLLETLGQAHGKAVLTTKEFLDEVKAKYPIRAQRVPAVTGAVPRLEDIYLLTLRPGTDVKAAVTAYRGNANVSFAEPNYLFQPASGFAPNDPFYTSSGTWGQNDSGVPYADLWGLYQIKADQAVAFLVAQHLTAGQGLTIAIMDTGVDCTHPDLVGACNTVDDKDYVNNDDDASDDNGHGTFVAGVAAARGNNGMGILGVAYGSTVLPIKVADATGLGTSMNLGNGIVYAVSKGADVVNISGVSGNLNGVVSNALATARRAGVVSVAAAGNNGATSLWFPASSPDTIAVGATDHARVVTTWSNRTTSAGVSQTAHHLVAPGGESSGDQNSILSLRAAGTNYGTQVVSSDYAREGGTSYSTAYVSGTVALLFSLHPTLSVDAVHKVLELTAQDIGPDGVDPVSGYGIVNAAGAVGVVQELLTE